MWEAAVGISRPVSLQTSLQSLWCPHANAPEKGARMPWGTRQAEEALEGGACSSFCQEKPRAETFICASCLPVPPSRNNGGLSGAGFGAR